MKSLNDISLRDIAPSSILDDKNISALISALDPELKLITDDITQEFILSRIDELDSGVLDLLAWQFHVDFYDLARDIDTKRRQIKDSILWHMKKGTSWAILKALDMIGVDAEFINWYEFDGAPYTFKIKANIRPDFYNYGDKEQITRNILRAINESKATRSFLAGLDAYLIDKADLKLFAGIAQGKSGNVKMLLEKIKAPEPTRKNIGIAQGLSGHERINLSRPDSDKTDIEFALAENKNRSISLGVELEQMEELLARFESRMFERLAQTEARITADFDRRQEEINARFDEILDLMRWK